MIRLAAIIIAMACLGSTCAAAGGGAKMDLAKPTPDQAAWHDLELEMFIHFGPASWQDSEYDTLATPLSEIDRIQPITVEAVRLICTKSAAEPIIRRLAVYNAGVSSR